MTFGPAWKYGDINSWKGTDGQTCLSFPLVFVDPRKPAITFQATPTKFPIPDEVRVAESDEQLLKEANGDFTQVKLAPERPERVELVIGNREFDMTPPSFDFWTFEKYPVFSSAMMCETHEEKTSEILRLRNSLNSWQVRVTYRMGAVVPVRRHRIVIDPRKLFDAFFEATARGSILWSSIEINSKAESVLMNYMAGTGLKLPYNWDQQLRMLVPDIVSAFFETVRAGDAGPGRIPLCGLFDPNAMCARLNFRWRENHELVLERKWEQKAFLPSQETWVTRTPYHR
jgi:hypothetical protein